MNSLGMHIFFNFQYKTIKILHELGKLRCDCMNVSFRTHNSKHEFWKMIADMLVVFSVWHLHSESVDSEIGKHFKFIKFY